LFIDHCLLIIDYLLIQTPASLKLIIALPMNGPDFREMMPQGTNAGTIGLLILGFLMRFVLVIDHSPLPILPWPVSG
jgi:hypothetical protein